MPQGFLRRTAALGLLLLFSGFATAAAQAGRISGQVTDQVGAPIEAARLLIVGTSLIETTNREGRYSFRSVNPGHYQIRVFAIGYQSKTDSTTVTPSETAALDFKLTAAPVTLEEVVITATGEQRKLEVANSVSTIDVTAATETGATTDLASVISGRAAGVQVLKSGGATGTGSRLRIRGSNSVSLNNEPLYYIDGVRLESTSSDLSIDVGGGIGGGATSRINDINPEDIEDIEIVKGPAAATLYGIQASNGVVRITTKRGNQGRPRWSLFSEIGAVSDANTYPINWFGRDNTGSGYDGFCIVQYELDGLCTQTSVQRYTPLQDPATRPLKAGLRQQYGGNVSGGNEFATYFLSGTFESEDGVFRLPKFEEDSIRTARGSVPQTQLRPNALQKVSLRANVNANVARNAELSASVGYVSSNTRLPENDNSFLSITGSGEASFNPPEFNRGWFLIPAELFAEQNNQGIERFTGGLTGVYHPSSWLTTRATLGYDIVGRTDVQFFPTGQVADFLQNRDGSRASNHFTVSQTSADFGATAQYKLSSTLGSRTSAGAQFFRELTNGTFAIGRGLAAGSGTISGAATTESAEQTVENRSAGVYVEEQLSLKERLFVTGAVRFDDNSAFGSNFGGPTYPKASVSWLVSDEPFFHVSWVHTLRLRAAVGASGQQPGTIDAFRYFTASPGKIGGENQVGVTFASLGNPNLKPERSREIEMGLDMNLLNDRVTLEFSYYNKSTRDAIVSRELAPSLGSSETQFLNLGRVSNKGFELAIDARVIDKPNFAWDVTLSGSTNKNRLEELGQGVAPIIFGFGQQRHVEGYPLGGYWSRPILSFKDANGDGIIDASEFVLGDTAVFVGSGIPTREASLNTAITLFNGRLRLGGQFDYRGGHIIDNSIESFRCTPILVCRGLVDRKAPLKEQAAAQAVLNDAVEFGFFEPAWFIKLRELTLTYTAPASWAHMFRADRMSVTLSARNLMTITDYSGVDPEVNGFGQSNFSSTDFESQPQVRYYTVRFNFGF